MAADDRVAEGADPAGPRADGVKPLALETPCPYIWTF